MKSATIYVYKNNLTNLSKISILNRIKKYGFIECINIISFLHFVCDEETLDIHALRFIHSRVNDCLKEHAVFSGRYNPTDFIFYFQDLKALRDELEFAISFQKF